MEVTILLDAQAVAAHAAQRVGELLAKKSDAVLGLATGSTPIALYQQLIKQTLNGELSFRNATTFNLDEYIGIAPSSPQSYRSFMNRELFDQIDIDPANTYLPWCAEENNPRDLGAQYEQLIRNAGGIDLQILGIGRNGHIGFNEPSSSFASTTRVKTLTQQTVQDNSRLFATGEFQPRLAITMGIATILQARHILLLATGEHKARGVRDAVEGPMTAMCPASALQLHPKTAVILDEAAATDLREVDYYRWVDSQNKALVKRYGHFHDV